MDKSKIGRDAENMVAQFFAENGIEVIENNFRIKGAEIDLIIKDREYIAFVEVKYRNSTEYGYPSDAVDYAKRKRICKAARFFLHKNHYPELTYSRFDVVSVINGRIEWFRNAFDYI